MAKTREIQRDSAVAESVATWPPKYSLFGLQVSAVNYDQAVASIESAALKKQPGVVACHAAHAIVTVGGDRQLRESANQFSMITPDGQPVRWAMNWLHKTGLTERVYGPELMWRLLGRAEKSGLNVYLYGGSPESLKMLVSNIESSFPNLSLVGSESPPYRSLSDDELKETAERINACDAQIVFIGLGCPKQDQFAAKQAERIQAIQICVGAAFDFHAGIKPVAPAWMQRNGLEWLFRLSCEPRRLASRYLVTNTIFLWRLAKATFARAEQHDVNMRASKNHG